MAFKTMHYPIIDARREQYRISKKEFADKLNLSWESANNKLLGQVEFSLTEVIAIADWWGLSMDELVGHKKQASPVLAMPSPDDPPAEAS